jgi:hypothetical protein
MDLARARRDLANALAVDDAGDRSRAVRGLLVRRGAEVLQIDPALAPGLGPLLHHVSAAPAGEARRGFAALLVLALAVDGVLKVSLSRPRLERAVCGLVESALPDVLWRAGYPYGAATESRCRFLFGLHATMEDHSQPLEPTFPGWLTGLQARRRD